MGIKQFFGGTATGRKDKPVNSTRRRLCQKRKSGEIRFGDERGWMLQEIYRVPGKWLDAYNSYTNQHAREDLQSCAGRGTLTHSSKIVRYNKLGLKDPKNAVGYALKKYQGFSNKNVQEYKQYGKNSPYTQFAALKDIRRGRKDKFVAPGQEKGPRFKFLRWSGAVADTKTKNQFRAGMHTGPSTTYKYNYRQGVAAKPKGGAYAHRTTKPAFSTGFMSQLNKMQAQRAVQTNKENIMRVNASGKVFTRTGPGGQNVYNANATANRLNRYAELGKSPIPGGAAVTRTVVKATNPVFIAQAIQKSKSKSSSQRVNAPRAANAAAAKRSSVIPNTYKMRSKWQGLSKNEQEKRYLQSQGNIAKRNAARAAAKKVNNNRAPSRASSAGGFTA